MTLRCRKGDMAYIIGEGDYSGYVVNVGDFLGTRILTRLDGVRCLETSVWEITSDSIPHSTMGIADRHLLPIRPGDLDETEETEKELTV